MTTLYKFESMQNNPKPAFATLRTLIISRSDITYERLFHDGHWYKLQVSEELKEMLKRFKTIRAIVSFQFYHPNTRVAVARIHNSVRGQ